MPRTPVDYSKTIIYKLVHKEDYDNVNTYIVSTTYFRKSKSDHKSNCCNEKQKAHTDKKYQYIREHGGWDNWNMIEVQKFPCNDKREAEAREEYWRCHFNAQLNSKKAYTTYVERLEQKKQYYGQNKDKFREYYEIHKDKILEQRKKYYNKKNNKTDSSSDDKDD